MSLINTPANQPVDDGKKPSSRPAIEQNGWPLVSIHFRAAASDAEVVAWLQSMTGLLERGQVFVVVMLTTLDSQFSPFSRKQQSLWFKQNREALGRYCVGIGRVLLDVDNYERLAGEAMQKAVPCSLFADTEQQRVYAWAEQQLATHTSRDG